MKKRLHYIILGLMLPIILTGCGSSNNNNNTSEEKVLRIYTSRPGTSDAIINKTFTEKTGIKVEVTEVKDNEVVDRLSQEKEKADIVMFNGAEKISELKSKKLLQAHQTEKTTGEVVDSKFYGSEWVALTQKPRAFVTLKENTEALSAYTDLANAQFEKNVFIQAKKAPANEGLLADLYVKDPVEADKFMSGVGKNVALKSEESDFDQIKSLVKKNDAKGVAVVDVSAVEMLKQSKNTEDKEIYEKIKVVYPKETFTNISVIGVSSASKQQDAAGQYIKYLLTREVQTEYMLTLGEYPVRSDVALLESLATFPPLTSRSTNYEKLGDNKEKTDELFKKYNWA